jgi:hypothetical protein
MGFRSLSDLYIIPDCRHIVLFLLLVDAFSLAGKINMQCIAKGDFQVLSDLFIITNYLLPRSLPLVNGCILFGW